MSNKTLTLRQPLLINGVERTELQYNPLEITADLFLEACQRAAHSDKSNSTNLKFKENDYALHMYLGMGAVIAVNPEISFEDLERAKGFDMLSFQDIGWLFILRTSGETSKESTYDVPLENTAEPFTQELKRSEAEG